MGDRCTTHKARACQKCAGDADRCVTLRDLAIERGNAVQIARLAEESEKGWRRDADVAWAEVDRLRGVVAKVRVWTALSAEARDLGWDDLLHVLHAPAEADPS